MNTAIDKILKCEDKYIQFFCKSKDEGKYIRYEDNEINDMYDHNFIELKGELSEEESQKIIDAEIEKRQEQKTGFCKIKINDNPQRYISSDNVKKAEPEHLGIYIYGENNTLNWRAVEGCEIKKVSNEGMIKELIAIDISYNNGTCSEDFCIRRVERKGKVYIDENSCDSYICYYKGIPVGHCELLIEGSIAKIEEFIMHPDYQRKRIGTTLLKYLVNKAMKNGAEIVYLLADEDDTAKEMYLKLGFKKIYDLYSLLWIF